MPNNKKSRVAMQQQAVAAASRELRKAKQKNRGVDQAQARLDRAKEFLKTEEAQPDDGNR